MADGTIKWYDRKKGYGFISIPDGDDVFVHYTGLAEEGSVLHEGDAVIFEIAAGEKGARADKVSVVSHANQ